MAEKRIIAIDIDDVISATTEGARLWGNARGGVELTKEHYNVPGEYWGYYEHVWEQHGLKDVLKYEEMEGLLASGKMGLSLVEGASEAIDELQKQFKIVLITARPPEMEAMTKAWIIENFAGEDVELYHASNKRNHPDGVGDRKTKGELCVELGAFLLIDDNVQHCRSAMDSGIDTVLFGDYGWQLDVPKDLKRRKDWPAVLEYIHGL